MNEYTYNQLSIGDCYKFHVVLTEDKFKQFLELTGDTNPLHTDADYARNRGFKDRVAYGMLTACFLSTMAGVYMPGKLSLIHSVEIKFVKPVFVGDEILLSSTISEKNDTFKIMTLEVIVTNQDKVRVAKAIMKVGVAE